MNLSEIEITEVSAHYGETKSLPDYSNVKPGYSLKAVVKPGQDPEAVKQALEEQVKQWVWEDCDTALEREGRRAEFWKGPRFDLRVLGDDWIVVIVPAEAELPKPWSSIHCAKSGWRLEALKKYAQEDYSKLAIVDLSQGGLEALPDLREYDVAWLNHPDATYCILFPLDFDTDTWHNDRRIRWSTYRRLSVNFLPWITEQAQSKEAILINCLDGDLSKLPDLAPKQPENAFIVGADELWEEVAGEMEVRAKADQLFDDLEDDDPINDNEPSF